MRCEKTRLSKNCIADIKRKNMNNINTVIDIKIFESLILFKTSVKIKKEIDQLMKL